MSDLHASTNFIWSTANALGLGATAVVYKGMSKVNGQGVAVKVFKLSTPWFKKMQIREFELLREMQHENIVKLLAKETDPVNGKQVLIMELCTGGSLYDTLNDPENFYGLKESEFLLVLEHLCAGVKYLREHKLIHRDLKPGNIMKFIHEDGTTVYKLADFGSARELDDHESFQSICGTVEYLSPDIFGRLLDDHKVGTFPVTVDLWSIGVTLYHLATGQLPFRPYKLPYKGRRNTDLYNMINAKEPGVICVTQNKPDGPFKLQRELPRSCQLSYGLQKLITPLISNLFERDEERTFDTFFKEVDLILSRRPVYLFHVNDLRLVTLFILPGETCEDLKNYITEQTDIQCDIQILLYKTSGFRQECLRGTDFLNATQIDPLFLFDKRSNTITLNPLQESQDWKYVEADIHSDKDCAKVQRACIIAHECKRQIEEHSLYSKLISKAIESYTKFIHNKLNKLFFTFKNLQDKSNMLIQHAGTLQVSQQLNDNSRSEKNICKSFAQLKKDLAALDSRASLLYDNYCSTVKKVDIISDDSKHVLHRAPEGARAFVILIRKNWQRMSKNLYNALPAPSQAESHRLCKIRVNDLMHKIMKLENTVISLYQQLAVNFGVWYKKAQNINLEIDTLSLDITKQKDILQNSEKQLYFEAEEHKKFVEQLEQKRQRRKKTTLNKFLETNSNFEELVSENNVLVNKLEELIASDFALD